MNVSISFNDKQGKILLTLLIIALTVGALIYFYNKVQKKQEPANAGPETSGKAEQQLHQHITHMGQALAAYMSSIEQSVNGRLDDLEYNTRPRPAIAAVSNKPPIGFRPPYMDNDNATA